MGSSSGSNGEGNSSVDFASGVDDPTLDEGDSLSGADTGFDTDFSTDDPAAAMNTLVDNVSTEVVNQSVTQPEIVSSYFRDDDTLDVGDSLSPNDDPYGDLSIGDVDPTIANPIVEGFNVAKKEPLSRFSTLALGINTLRFANAIRQNDPRTGSSVPSMDIMAGSGEDLSEVVSEVLPTNTNVAPSSSVQSFFASQPQQNINNVGLITSPISTSFNQARQNLNNNINTFGLLYNPSRNVFSNFIEENL